MNAINIRYLMTPRAQPAGPGTANVPREASSSIAGLNDTKVKSMDLFVKLLHRLGMCVLREVNKKLA